MDGFIDLPVGTEFGYGGKRYQVVKAPIPEMCDGCTDETRGFCETDIAHLCALISCASCVRHDKTDVIVIEKEESNE